MSIRRAALPLATTIVVALVFGAQRAHASSYLGSPDVSATPDAYVCADCPAGTSVGFQQVALSEASVAAPEDGVITFAGVYARRIAGDEAPRIAVLRRAPGGMGVTVVDSAPLPVTEQNGALHQVEDLHLTVRAGDQVGFVFRTGEVDLGIKTRPQPDGAIRSFTQPCAPCGMDGDTGIELLYEAVVEPDVDQDGLGDETQDSDGGGLGEDWEDDWFDDFEEGDELDEDLEEDVEEEAAPAARRRLRVLDVKRVKCGVGASILVRAPKAGRLRASITLPANRRTGAGPFLTLLTGEKRVKRAGLVRLHLASTVPGARALAGRTRLRTKLVAALRPRSGALKVRMRSARL